MRSRLLSSLASSCTFHFEQQSISLLVSDSLGIAVSNSKRRMGIFSSKQQEKAQYDIVFVLGGPGSGKGTQSAKLVEEFGVVHLSAGDLLRAHMKSGSKDGTMVAEMIKNGQIVPSHVTVSLLEGAMEKHWKEQGKKAFLIDGFPRNEENRSSFEKQTGMTPKFVLFFDCSEEVMQERLLGRQEGRTDDNIETIKKRFRVFKESSVPVVDYYAQQGKVATMNAEKSPEDVYTDVREAYTKYMLSGNGSSPSKVE